jgi:hypothetical protein
VCCADLFMGYMLTMMFNYMLMISFWAGKIDTKMSTYPEIPEVTMRTLLVLSKATMRRMRVPRRSHGYRGLLTGRLRM